VQKILYQKFQVINCLATKDSLIDVPYDSEKSETCRKVVGQEVQSSGGYVNRLQSRRL
jgi:hypothetical protein